MEAQREAFEKAFQDHLEQVERLIARHTKDPEERLDLTQEVFIRAYSAFSQFRGESSVGTWLHRITINVCANAARAKFRHQAEALEQARCISSIEGFHDVVEDLAHAERQRMLKQSLRLVSAEQLIVLSLRFSDQLTISEVAEVIGEPVATVKSRLRAALDRIHSSMRFLERGQGAPAIEAADAESFSLDDALPEEEGSARVYHSLGSMYLRKGLTEAALREWANAQTVAPTFLDSYLVSAQKYVETNRPRKAVETLEAAVEQIRSADLHTSLAKLYLDLGDVDDGIQHSSRALDIDPLLPDAHFEAGRAHFKRAEILEALRSLSVRGDVPEDPVATSWRRSAMHFERAVELRPDHAKARSYLSQAYLETKMPEKAEQTSSEALTMAGDDDSVYHQAGWVHYKTGKLTLAERYLRHSISLRATAQKLNLLGFVYLAQRRHEEAYVAFNEGVSVASDRKTQAHLCTNLASTAIRLGRYDDAVDSAQKSLKLDPEQIHARCNLSQAYLLQGTSAHVVVKLCEDGLEKSPAHICFHRLLAQAHLKLGEYEAALAEANTAIELEPEIADRWALRARVLIKLRRSDEAREDLKAALDLEADHEESRKLLADLDGQGA